MRAISGPRRIGTSGFALVDALIALAVFAVVTGLLFETVGSATLASQRISERRQATLVAQSVLALAGGSGAAVGARSSGRDGEFVWRIQTRPYADEAVDNGWGLQLVTVTVSKPGDDGIAATLKTLRLAR